MNFFISKRSSEIKPVALMKLTQINDPDELLKDHNRDDIIIQKKYDGWKCQVIKTNGEIKIYSRRGNEKTNNFPELIEALKSMPNNTMVEGELVYWYKGKQDESKVTSLAGSSPENSKKKAKELPGELKLHLYDILWYNGKNVSDKNFSERDKLLRSTIKPNNKIQLTKNYPFSDWQKVINDAIKENGEGIVLKLKNKPYKYKKLGENEPKPEFMFKFKGSGGKSESDDYVIYDYEISPKGKLKAKFGQYYKGKLYHISSISNFSKENEKKIKDKLKKGNFTIEIGFQERIPGGLRSQRFIRYREDKSPKDATMNEFHVKHIENFKIVKNAFILSKRHRCILGGL